MTPQRVVVALDGSAHSLAALAEAAELAARLRVELTGLFVEDEELLRLCQLPCARELRLPAGAARPLREEALLLELSALSGRAERSLHQAASRLRLRATFQLLRGAVAEQLLQASAAPDVLMILGWASRPLGARGRAPRAPSGRLGSTARALLQRGTAPLLLVRERAGLFAEDAPLLRVLLDPGAEAAELLAQVEPLLEAGLSALELVAMAATDAEALRPRRAALGFLGARALPGRVHTLLCADAGALLAGLRDLHQQAPALLLCGPRSCLLQADLDALPGPLLRAGPTSDPAAA